MRESASERDRKRERERDRMRVKCDTRYGNEERARIKQRGRAARIATRAGDAT